MSDSSGWEAASHRWQLPIRRLSEVRSIWPGCSSSWDEARLGSFDSLEMKFGRAELKSAAASSVAQPPPVAQETREGFREVEGAGLRDSRCVKGGGDREARAPVPS